MNFSLWSTIGAVVSGEIIDSNTNEIVASSVGTVTKRNGILIRKEVF